MCVKCNDVHYLNEKASLCLVLPEGIPGCEQYQDINTCVKCKESLYPYQNQCYQLNPQDYVDNCKYYNSER